MYFQKLNRRHSKRLDLVLLSIDEGTTGYRDDSFETVIRNEVKYGLPLQILSVPKFQSSNECIYSSNAYRGFAREFIKDLERLRPRAMLDIIKSGEDFRVATTTKMPERVSDVVIFLARNGAKLVFCWKD